MNNSCNNDPRSFQQQFTWHDTKIWMKSAKNTLWCLLGCVIGDFATIFWFQIYSPNTPVITIMALAIVNGILTSIILETIILSQQMRFVLAFKTAIGMSLVSMVSMELAMNLVDYFLLGKAQLVWWVIPPMLLAGFLTPWPYNYWRLKKLGKSCH